MNNCNFIWVVTLKVTVQYKWKTINKGCWDSVKGDCDLSIEVKITILTRKKVRFDNWPLKTGWALNTVQLNAGLTVRGFDNWIQQRSLHDHSENLLIIKLCMGRALESNFPHGGGNLNEPIFKSLNVWCGERGKVWMPGVGRGEKVQSSSYELIDTLRIAL